VTANCEHNHLHIRLAQWIDAGSIASIYNGYVDAGGATFDATHWSTDYVLNQLALPEPDGWFVAFDDRDHSILGWASVHRFSHRHGYRFSLESAIYLRPDSRGAGIADSLQQHLDEHCQRCNVHHLMAKIVADNRRSIAFHHRNGFEMVGIQREVGNMTGDWIDVAIMQKIYS
jgi:phosphinothricin acetyltransferase